MGAKFGAEFLVGDDDEFPRLQAVGGGGEDERFLERFPEVGGDGFGGVESFGGVAPVEMGDEGGGRERLGRGHGRRAVFEWGMFAGGGVFVNVSGLKGTIARRSTAT